MCKNLLLILCCISATHGWTQDTIYLDSHWKETQKKEQASYFKIVDTQDKIINAKTYSISGVIKSERNYYLKGKKKYFHGEQKNWYESGELHTKADYKKGKRDGSFLSYWKSGVVKRKDNYDNGKFKGGNCFDENGKEVTYYEFEKSPQFQGGKEGLIQYLQANIKPGIGTGKVVVKFTIEPDGSIKNPMVMKSDNTSLNKYSLEIIKNMPNWSPAFQDGNAVRVTRTLPLVYTN